MLTTDIDIFDLTPQFLVSRVTLQQQYLHDFTKQKTRKKHCGFDIESF